MKIKYVPSLTYNEILKNVISFNPALHSHYKKIVLNNFSRKEYYTWKKAQYITPFIELKSKEEGFSLFHYFRKQESVDIPFLHERKTYFFWQRLTCHERFFHDFTSKFYIHEVESNDNKYLEERILRGVKEEAIASSLLEGANTTRSQAIKMISEKRSPKTEGEQMIINNYNTILWIENEARNEAMSESLLLKIQSKLLENTSEDIKNIGRFREDSDKVCVQDQNFKSVHIPPKKSFLDKELVKFIDFANDNESKEYFFHPILKAIILHFMIGYLHPFCDGNGRTARAIFYWYLLKNGFENIGFLPISTEIMKKRSLYDSSFIYTEQEYGNITYSVNMMIEILESAKRSFEEYIKKEKENIKEKRELEKKYYDLSLNTRQIDLIQYFKKYPEKHTDFKYHATIQNISLLTSRKDLLGLEKSKLLFSKVISNKRLFYPTDLLFNY